MPESSILDARLAEIDRRLRTIQTDLAPPVAVPGDPPRPRPASRPPSGGAPPPAENPGLEPLPPPTPLRPAPPPAEDAADVLLAQLRDLSDAHEHLLELHRELLSQYAALLTLPGAAEPGGATAGAASITAGPFPDATAVRGFQQALAALPGVQEVDVREYLDANRVVFEVRVSA